MKRKIPNVFEAEERGLRFWIMDGRYHMVKQDDGTFKKGRRERFETQALAQGRAEVLFNNVFQSELKIQSLAQDVMIDAKRGYDLIQPLGGNIYKACEYYAEFLKTKKNAIVKVSDAVAKWMDHKEREKIASGTLINYRSRTKRFSEAFPDKLIHEVDYDSMHKWLHSLPAISNITRTDYCNTLSEFFEWCIFPNKWIKENPCNHIEFNVRNKSEVAILSVAEAKRIFESAKSADPEILRYLVLTMFVGLRPESEAFKVHRDDIDGNVIRVHSGKTGELRYVDMEEGVLKWLIKKKWKGPLLKPNFRRRWREFKFKLGFRVWPDPKYKLFQNVENWKDRPKWAHDVTRHTYCSYHLAAFQNEALTIHKAGHSVRMFRKHYKRPIPKTEGEKFWDLVR